MLANTLLCGCDSFRRVRVEKVMGVSKQICEDAAWSECLQFCHVTGFYPKFKNPSDLVLM